MINKLLIILLLILTVSGLKAEYKEIQIPTRLTGDKKYLSADIHYSDTISPKPVILIQTPYNKNLYRLAFYADRSVTGIQLPFDLSLYNYVVVDWRGFYGSKTADTALYDRGFDGYDVVEWIAAQPWCNGKVGTWGESALGLIQFQTARQNPPHLVCAVPIVKDYLQNYEKYYFGGDLRKLQVESLEKLGFLTYNLVTSHPSKDFYWKLLENSSNYPDQIKIPLLMIEGWFDHYPADVINAFWELRVKSDPAVRLKHKMIVGPWIHENVGQAQQGDLKYPLTVDVPYDAVSKFFGFYLLNEKINWDGEPIYKYYSIGDDKWLTEESPEKKDSLTLFFHDDGTLQKEPMPVTFQAVPPDTINFDPRDPSPSIGGALFDPLNKQVQSGPRDISQNIEKRNDILVFSTDTLESDLSVNGKIHVFVYVSSGKTDTDFAARLCDVFPDGRSMMLTQAVVRGRYRNSTSSPELMKPDSIYKIEIVFEDIAITFKQGHKLRIDISSSDYPFFDVNPNTGSDLYKAGDTLTAQNLMYHTYEMQSQVVLPISGTVGVNNLPASSGEISIFPNPATDHLTVALPNAAPSQITVYNLQGERVDAPAKATTNGYEISTSALPAGMYFARVISGGNVVTKAFLVVR